MSFRTHPHRHVIIWLGVSALMIFGMVIIGAITRLTESGLSIVEWKPFTGALPPLNDAAWQRVYELYQQSPEFAQKHFWMEIDDFKRIFFWEWLHRLWGRLIGVVYAVPLIWFWVRKKIPEGYKPRLLILLALGGFQGFVGWWMVSSGLVDRPSVDHFRLATHLSIALFIYGFILWTIFDLMPSGRGSACGKRMSLAGLGLVCVTIVWGAFVAGLDAGVIYNTFPLMDGAFTPAGAFSPLYDHGWVQFTHRYLALVTACFVLFLAWKVRLPLLAFTVFVQVGLGIGTLLTQVYLPLAVLHQAVAVVLLSLMVKVVHDYFVKP